MAVEYTTVNPVDVDAQAVQVKVVNVEAPVELTGDVVVDTLGALDDAAEDDPDAASATIPSLLRGILEQLIAANALLTTIASNTTPPE